MATGTDMPPALPAPDAWFLSETEGMEARDGC
jgi:hypothetical protein